MSNLYSKKLAWVYDEIYQGFIDYKIEYNFYKSLCLKFNSTQILEIACGTGNLAKSFTSDFEKYLGLDFSESMLHLAKKKFPEGNFVQGDMRNLQLLEQFDTALITGRSTSYLLNNNDLEQTFKSVYTILKSNGIFIFDCINADLFMPYILQNENVTHISRPNGKQYERDSIWKKHESNTYHLIEWKSTYYKIQDCKRIVLGKDSSLFRAFTKVEICKALKTARFQIVEILDKSTYAFDTHVYICRKI